MTDDLPLRSCIVTYLGEGRGLHYMLGAAAGVPLVHQPVGSMLDLFTEDQMRAYGDARAAAATERAANLAHNKALHCESHDNPYGQGAALDIEDAIRGS